MNCTSLPIVCIEVRVLPRIGLSATYDSRSTWLKVCEFVLIPRLKCLSSPILPSLSLSLSLSLRGNGGKVAFTPPHSVTPSSNVNVEILFLHNTRRILNLLLYIHRDFFKRLPVLTYQRWINFYTDTNPVISKDRLQDTRQWLFLR